MAGWRNASPAACSACRGAARASASASAARRARRSGGSRRRRRPGRPPPDARHARGGRGSDAYDPCAAPAGAGRHTANRATTYASVRAARPPGDHRHPLAVAGVPGQRSLDHQRAVVEVAPGQRGVRPAYPARGERRAEPPVGEIGLGHDHEARGVAVEPVHDAGSPLGAARRASVPRATSAFTRVSSQWPGAGCTTSPAGLSMTARCSSS